MWCFVWHLQSAAIKIQKLQYLWNGARDAKGQRQFIVQSVDQPDCTYSDQTTAPGYVLQRIWWSRWHIRNRTTSRNWRLRLWRSGTIYHKTQSASRSRISGTLWACVNEVRTYTHTRLTALCPGLNEDGDIWTFIITLMTVYGNENVVIK